MVKNFSFDYTILFNMKFYSKVKTWRAAPTTLRHCFKKKEGFFANVADSFKGVLPNLKLIENQIHTFMLC